MQTSLHGDERLAVIFRNHAVKNDGKSAEAGRPIFDDIELCEIRFPGSRNVYPFPALSISHKVSDSMYGTDETPVTYAERFSKQYQQFKAEQSQTMSGTPLQHAPFMTPGRCAELRALNVYTVEQLAMVDGQELKNLGSGGRDLKNAAIDYIEQSKKDAPNLNLQAELDALRAKNQVLEDDLKTARLANHDQAQFEEMNDQQLRDYIGNRTGGVIKGDVPRKTLLRMAREATPTKAA